MAQIDIPVDCPTIYTLYNFVPLTQQDKEACLVITLGTDVTGEQVEAMRALNDTLTYVRFELPGALDAKRYMVFDQENYYYTTGRTKEAFIVLIDKKTHSDFSQCDPTQLHQRLICLAFVMFNIDPAYIYALSTPNWSVYAEE